MMEQDTNTKIAELRERFQTIFDASPTGIVIVNERGVIETINPSFSQLFGYESEELKGQNIEVVVPPEYRARHAQLVQSFIKNPSTRVMGVGRELFGLTKNNELRPIEVTLNPIQLSTGLVVMATVIDLSERKKYLKQIEEQNLRFSLAAKGLSVGIWDWINVKSSEVYWSPKFYQLLGYKPNEIPATLENFKKAVHPIDKDRTFEMLESHLKNAEDFDVECRLKTKNGNYKWFRVSGIVSRNKKSEPQRMIGSIQDINDKKLYEEELLRSNSELENFAYVATHDLQSPLRHMVGFASLLQKDYKETKLDEAGYSKIEKIVKAGKRLQNLLDDLLEYSRVGRTTVEFKYFSMNEAVKSALEYLDFEIKKLKAEVEIEELPEVKGNIYLMTQVFQNFISNALKFQKKGAVPKIRIFSKKEGNHWVFKIEDNGIGFEEEFSEKAFKVFQRLHKQENYQGTGMGLSICKQVIDKHRGQIWVNSKPGQGSVFCFSIPNV